MRRQPHFPLQAFHRHDDPYIVKTCDSSVNLNELWHNSLATDEIIEAIGEAGHATESALVRFLTWQRHALGFQLTDDELAEHNRQVKHILAAISCLTYLGSIKAIMALPPNVAELHEPLPLDQPQHCESCHREIYIICAECGQEWPCDTTKIPVDNISNISRYSDESATN